MWRSREHEARAGCADSRATPSLEGPLRCECGVALAYAAGAGVTTVLCPACDCDCVDEVSALGVAEPPADQELMKPGKEATRGSAMPVSCTRSRATPRTRSGRGQPWRGHALPAALLSLCAVLGGCAEAHRHIEGPPLSLHLCDAMPEDDQRVWGEAADRYVRDHGTVRVGDGARRAAQQLKWLLSSL